MKAARALALAVMGSLSLAGCGDSSPTGPSSSLTLQPTSYHDMRGWENDNHVEALGVFLKSCAGFALQGDGDATGQGQLLAPAVVWKTICRDAQLVPANDETLAKLFFEKTFVPFKATNGGNPVGLFTGYYEPSLMGSRTQHRPFMYPVYAVGAGGPPHLTRTQIDMGMLQGQAPVIAYVDDPVQLFFMHIQGSGRIQLDTGETIRVGYDGANGEPYVSIGKVLADKGILKKEAITMPVLQQWLHDHPNEMWQVMWENPSYIFFREVRDGPIGAEKVPLTPGRSLAVDVRYVPLGSPVFVDTVLPETPTAPMTIHRKLLIAQDTGSAIRGPVRGDIFFGFGPAAEHLAGRMKQSGEAVVLVPRSLALMVSQ